jgi:hypothetical protein
MVYQMSDKKINAIEKKAKKDLEESTKAEKQIVLDTYRNLYDDQHMKQLYKEELPKYFDFLAKKKQQKMKNITQEEDDDEIIKVRVNEQKMKSKIEKNLDSEDYEEIFTKTTTYIKDNIFHGYDSKFYVLNKNSNGHILPLEYSNADFNSTFSKYFPHQISDWFDLYSKKVVLTINNTKPRTFKEETTNYLNLFSGYRFNRNDKKDLERIEKGNKGVQFILNHIKGIWNSGNDQCYEYDRNWICKLIAGYKLKTMIYLKGKMGRGKTAIVNFLKVVLGLHICMTISNDSPFMTEFNGSLIGMALCCLDEVVHNFESFKSLYNKLKPYITDVTMSYRNLYEKLKTLLNLTSFIMTGNYDMLRLDDPSKGEDRRIKVNDVADIVKDREYCDMLDAYLADVDVQYSFFWYCIDNHKPSWDELQELKLLPVTETKKQMIIQSLDSGTMFLKAKVNCPKVMNKDIKPKDLYDQYVEFMKKPNNDKKQFMNQNTFLSKIKDFPAFVTVKLNVRVNKGNPTNYIHIDRAKLIAYFTEKFYFNEYDDIHDKLNEVEDGEESESVFNYIEKTVTVRMEDHVIIAEEYKCLKDDYNELAKYVQGLEKHIETFEQQNEQDDVEDESEQLHLFINSLHKRSSKTGNMFINNKGKLKETIEIDLDEI